MLTGTKDSITEKPTETHEERNRALFSVLAILALAVAVAVATGWMCRSRCPGRSGTGTRRAREVDGGCFFCQCERLPLSKQSPVYKLLKMLLSYEGSFNGVNIRERQQPPSSRMWLGSPDASGCTFLKRPGFQGWDGNDGLRL